MHLHITAHGGTIRQNIVKGDFIVARNEQGNDKIFTLQYFFINLFSLVDEDKSKNSGWQ